jgi:formylglycine-generating enzyme required for sulfatase activity
LSWTDAKEYADWLSETSAKRHHGGPATRYRLPTSAEWEYAARNRLDCRMYHWGDAAAAGRGHCTVRKLNIEAQTAPVDQFRKTDSGIYDIVGDVWQWTADVTNPEEASDGPPLSHMLRGGAWNFNSWI